MKGRVVLLTALFALAALPIQAQHSTVKEALRAELEEMYETDQSYRVQLHSLAKEHGSNSEEFRAIWEKQSQIDAKNIARLEKIIEEHGWPGQSLVGKKGAMAAFLILQHADYKYQKKYLPLVREAVAKGELDAQRLALLVDRVRTREGKKQIYGTQLRLNQAGDWELYPIEDEQHVDQRRAAVGLPPLKEYLALFDLEYEPPREK